MADEPSSGNGARLAEVQPAQQLAHDDRPWRAGRQWRRRPRGLPRHGPAAGWRTRRARSAASAARSQSSRDAAGGRRPGRRRRRAAPRRPTGRPTASRRAAPAGRPAARRRRWRSCGCRDGVAEPARHGLEHDRRRGDDLRADAVARQEDELTLHGAESYGRTEEGGQRTEGREEGPRKEDAASGVRRQASGGQASGIRHWALGIRH